MMRALSVIVPAYGVGKYLSDCLSGCARQKADDVSVIVSDDGSTDESARIADEFAARDARFVALHCKNGGVARARNAAMSLTDSEWLWFVDGDDVIADDSFSALRPAMATGSDIVYFRYMMYGDEQTGDTGDTGELKALAPEDIAELRRQTVFRHSNSPQKRFWMMSSSFSIYNMDFLRKNRVVTPPLRKGQDALFNFSALMKCETASTLDRTLYYYRRNEGSVSVKYNPNIAVQMFDVIKTFGDMMRASDDPALAARLDQRIMQMTRIGICLNFCHAQNLGRYSARRAEFMRHMNRPDVRKAFKNARKVEAPLFDRAVYLLIKHRQFMALNALYRLYTRKTHKTM